MSESRGLTGTTPRALDATPDALVDSLFEGAEFGLVLLDADLRFVRLNAAMALIDGVAVEDHIGRTLPDVLPASGEGMSAVARQVVETGRAVRDMRVSIGRDGDGGPRTVNCSFYPVRQDGVVAAVWGSIREVTEERRAHQAQERLAGELAEQQVISDEVFARAPAGMVLLWGPELSVRAYNRQALEQLPDRGKLTGRSLGALYPEARALGGTVRDAVMGRGETLHFEDVPLAFGGERALDGNRHYTFTAVPVPGPDGAAAGVLIVGQETTEAVRERRALERELASEQRIATQLQVSLMPDRLPDVPGVEIASAFRPAGDGQEIGGDFFDVFPVRPGCWMLVIGDVCGKGAEAAALTALARYTLRAAAMQEGVQPAELLAQLNEAIMRQRDDTRFLTAVCAFLDLGAGGDGVKITLAVAGHPPPLVAGADGAVTAVGGRGMLLGVWDSPELVDEVLHLRADERLVFYTDGVLEAGSPDNELGEAGLATALSVTAADSAASTVAAIEGAVLARAGATPRDDMAVLVLHPDPGGGR